MSTKKIAAGLTLVLALTACAGAPTEQSARRDVAVITIDGIRCVVLDTGSYAGGIDCDFPSD